MIWESFYWKSDLIKDADILKRWAIKKTSIKQEVLFEKKIMISAYTIRKLIEAEKIGPDLKDEYWNLKCKTFNRSSNGKQLDIMNDLRIDEFYNIENLSPANSKIILKDLCDLIVHSYVFCLSQDDIGCIDGFFVTSDHHKDKTLYWIDLDVFIKVLNGIGKSDVCEMKMVRRNKKKPGWTITRKYIYEQK